MRLVLIIHRNFVSDHIVEFEDAFEGNAFKHYLYETWLNRRDFSHRQKLEFTDLDVWIRGQD